MNAINGRKGFSFFKLEAENHELVTVGGLSIPEFVKRMNRLAFLKRLSFSRFGIHEQPYASWSNGILMAGGFPNAYVTTGITNYLNLERGVGGLPIINIALESDNSAVTAATVYIHGSSATPNGTGTLNGTFGAGTTSFTMNTMANPPVSGSGVTFQGGTAETLLVLSSTATNITTTTASANSHATGSTAAWTAQVIKAVTSSAPSAGAVTYTGPLVQPADFASGGSNNPGTVNKTGLLVTATDAGTGLIDVVGGTGSGIFARSSPLGLTFAGAFQYTPGMVVSGIAI